VASRRGGRAIPITTHKVQVDMGKKSVWERGKTFSDGGEKISQRERGRNSTKGGTIIYRGSEMTPHSLWLEGRRLGKDPTGGQPLPDFRETKFPHARSRYKSHREKAS